MVNNICADNEHLYLIDVIHFKSYFFLKFLQESCSVNHMRQSWESTWNKRDSCFADFFIVTACVW